MSIILGISAFYHDSAAAIIVDGNIIAAAQEERFSRIKHDASFPKKAIEYVLKEANTELKNIDYVVFYEKPFLKFERLLETYLDNVPLGIRSFLKSMPLWLGEKLFQKNKIFKSLKEIDKNFKDIEKIKFSEHHLSHAASAFFSSPFKKSIILTIDGVGEWATTSVCLAENNHITIKKEIHYPHSIGLLYSAFTYFLGFKVNSGEYKVMGLAPYGKPKYKDLIFQKLVDLKSDGSFKLNMNFFNYSIGLTMTNNKFEKLLGIKRRKQEDKIEQHHMDLAASIQEVIEEIIIKIVSSISKEFEVSNLCMAGGVALNCVANGKILKENLFKNIWIQPAPGDAGAAIGCAQAFYYMSLGNTHTPEENDKMKGSYLGPKFSDEEVKETLDKYGAIYQKLDMESVLDLTSRAISDGKIIGWFQGRMEFGPRSLGNRSILADPRNETMQKNLNLKIKFRESFRPFAPSILFETVNKWFEIKDKSPYMLFTANVINEKKIILDTKNKNYSGIDLLKIKRSKIPAVTHVDYSARIQTVHYDTNPLYYRLIKKFYEITGVPILINTSFNIRGEPIVCNVEDAYNCFMGTDLDILVCNSFVMKKNQQNSNKVYDYKNKFQLD